MASFSRSTSKQQAQSTHWHQHGDARRSPYVERLRINSAGDDAAGWRREQLPRRRSLGDCAANDGLGPATDGARQHQRCSTASEPGHAVANAASSGPRWTAGVQVKSTAKRRRPRASSVSPSAAAAAADEHRQARVTRAANAASVITSIASRDVLGNAPSAPCRTASRSPSAWPSRRWSRTRLLNPASATRTWLRNRRT
jgi:hypothetical protein